jgi:glycosyltransferase involved in cell wall biosynthesis
LDLNKYRKTTVKRLVMPSISYAITACNEHAELDRLLTQLTEHIRPEDEIVVQLDTNYTPEVRNVVEGYGIGKPFEFHRIFASLNGDFASFKNNLNEHCTRDYIFQIDADEYLSDTLILNLPEVLELNPKIDVYYVPRINTVEGLTQEHIQKWGWHVNEEGWVNYPDFQGRICKNRKDIKWNGKVHERLLSAEGFVGQVLPAGFELMHPKTIERQEKQNNYYNTL